MKITINEKKLDLRTSNGTKISDICCYIDYKGEYSNIIRIYNGVWRVSEITSTNTIVTDGAFILNFSTDGKNIFLQGKYIAADNFRGGVKFCIFKGLNSFKADKIYVNYGTGFYDVQVADMQGKTIVRPTIKNQREESLDVGISISNSGKCLLAGAVTYENNFSSIEFSQNGAMELNALLYTKPIFKGEEIISDKFIILEENSLDKVLNIFSENVKTQSKVENLDEQLVKSGWCSWYYYGPNISEKIILENMSELKKRGVKVDCIQIDDGWNINRGEWEANDQFPKGMKWLADQIKEEGFIPGIWVAPLTATKNSEFLKKNKDMFVKDFDSNEPYGLISLDLSTKKAQEYLYRLFYKLSQEWGYRYIKYDFICYGMTAGKYFDPTFNGVKNYHKALEIMRSAVTEDTYLLSCTSPLYASIGKTHALRISRDIFERWDSVKSVAAHVLHRLHLNRYIKIDPDCALLRTSKNEDDECFRKCTRTEKEIETYLTLLGVSGGLIMLSDKISLLSDEQLEKFDYLFPVNLRSGKAIDLETNIIPSKIDCGSRRGLRTIVLFNWEDYEEAFIFGLDGECNIFDFWAKKFLEKSDKISLKIKPHECKVLQCSMPKENFSIIGTLNRLVPDIDWKREKNQIIVEGLKSGETIICQTDKTIKTDAAIVEKRENVYYITAKKEKININLGD